MASGYVAPAGDCDTLFAPRVLADPVNANTGFLSSNVSVDPAYGAGPHDMALAFALRVSPAIANTGFISQGGAQDFSQIFEPI